MPTIVSDSLKDCLISLDFLNNRKLSWGAKGVLLYILSLPASDIISVESLLTINKNNTKKQTFEYLEELKEHGFLTVDEDKRG